MYGVHFITFIMSIFIRWNWITKFSFNEVILMMVLDLMLIQSIFPKYSLIFNASSWYLSTIMFCYIFSNILIKILDMIRKYNMKVILIIIWSFQCFVAGQVTFITKYYEWFLYISPFFRIIDFFLGMIVARMVLDRKAIKKRTTILEIGLIPIFLISYISSFYLPIQFTRGICYSPVFILVIYVISYEKGILSKFISNDIFMKLASISFEFYMVHELILISIRNFFSNFINIEWHWIIKDGIVAIPSFILSIIIAIILNKYVSNKYYLKRQRNLIKI